MNRAVRFGAVGRADDLLERPGELVGPASETIPGCCDGGGVDLFSHADNFAGLGGYGGAFPLGQRELGRINVGVSLTLSCELAVGGTDGRVLVGGGADVQMDADVTRGADMARLGAGIWLGQVGEMVVWLDGRLSGNATQRMMKQKLGELAVGENGAPGGGMAGG